MTILVLPRTAFLISRMQVGDESALRASLEAYARATFYDRGMALDDVSVQWGYSGDEAYAFVVTTVLAAARDWDDDDKAPPTMWHKIGDDDIALALNAWAQRSDTDRVRDGHIVEQDDPIAPFVARFEDKPYDWRKAYPGDVQGGGPEENGLTPVVGD